MQTTAPPASERPSPSCTAKWAELGIRAATPADFPLLARMNRELIEDEGHRNPMTVTELEARFHRFVTEQGYHVDVLLGGDEVVAFATWRHRADVAEPSGQHIHLRQFYVARDRRGSGVGRRAVDLLFATRFQAGERVYLDVLETNPGGKAFWSRTGFAPYGTTMERIIQPEHGEA